LYEIDKLTSILHCSKLLESMCEEADNLAVAVEEKHDFTLIAKANAFRQKVRENREEKKKLGEKMHDLKEKLKFVD